MVTAGLSMMGDNVEHVITYWMLWQAFHSPALVGFEVVSHWLPFLVLGVPFGALAERYDCRRLIQISQLLFMAVSFSWGVLFLTDSLRMWEACVLLVLHGCAGALWGPAEQLMLHDFAEPQDLPGAVRMNATFRSIGVLCGPVVGSALLLVLGPAHGIFANIALYLPMTLLLLRIPQTGHLRSGYAMDHRPGFRETFSVLGTVAHDRVLFGMIMLAGLGALAIGGSLQVSMPDFATGNLAIGSQGLGYGTLLFAGGVGGVLGGFLLEATGRIRPTVRAVVVFSILFGVTTVVVATTRSYAAALVALAIGGFANLASNTVSQAIVQLRAPVEERGRVVGVYSMFGSGLRTGNGLTLALLGALWGIPAAVAIGGAFLVVSTVALALLMRRPPKELRG